MMNNGLTNGELPQPTPTPIPPTSQNAVTAAEARPTTKNVHWTTSGKDIMEIQRTSLAIGLNGGTTMSNGNVTSRQTDSAGVKFISLAAPLSNGSNQRINGYHDLRMEESNSAVVQTRLPMKATLHRQKQIPGRYFPSPSYTEFQRDVLESRPTPRRIVKKFKPKNSAHNSQLFPTGSPVKARTASDKSTWIANHVYSRGSQGVGSLERGPILPPDIDATLNAARQYSIPATTKFHDGNNSTLVTGLSKTLHLKEPMPGGDTNLFNQTVHMPR